MKTYERVYEILAKSPDFVTGESLAKELGISRTAIWKAIQSLQDQGVVITSVRKKGYHLEKGDILLSQEISKQLNFPVYFNPDSTSTQLDAKHGMERQDPAPSLYLASNQGSAKGRFERHFHTSPHGGIYMSIHLKPNCHFSELPPYTMMVAASIVKAIQRLRHRYIHQMGQRYLSEQQKNSWYSYRSHQFYRIWMYHRCHYRCRT